MDHKINYTEEEYEKRSEYVSKHMQKDVSDSVSYDEWSAREYDDYKVDSYDMAFNLYDKGYRREVDILEEVLKLFEKCNCTDRFYETLALIEARVTRLKGDTNGN